MLNFKNKKEIFDYIKKKFEKESKLILIRGSASNKNLKKFSDIDVEVYSNKLKKPYYEIIFLKEKPILVSVYFEKYKTGKKIKESYNVKVLSGKYNNKIKPDFSKENYNNKQKIKRDCQLCVDFLFKYIRSKDKRYLEYLQKKIK